MKLGYLSSAEVPSEAANALHVVKMCQALGDQGVDVVLYALDGQRELSDIQDFYGFAPNFLVQTFRHTKIPGGGYRLALKVWWREMHRPRCDFYYGRHLHTLLALTSLGVPCAFEAHAMPKNRYVQFLWRRLAKSKHCQAIVCITKILAEDVRKIVPANTRIEVLADAAEPASDHVTPARQWPGRVDVPQIGYVGHLYPGKGVEMVLELARSMHHLDFHIIGGRHQDIQYWQSQCELPNLHYHGFVQHAKLPALYQRLDVALLPAQKQVWLADGGNEIGRWTSPLKAFEYMSFALPIIVSRTPALEEIFTHNKTALLVDPEDIDGWQQALSLLIENPEYASKLGAQAQAEFLKHHTWAQRARAVMNLFGL